MKEGENIRGGRFGEVSQKDWFLSCFEGCVLVATGPSLQPQHFVFYSLSATYIYCTLTCCLRFQDIKNILDKAICITSLACVLKAWRRIQLCRHLSKDVLQQANVSSLTLQEWICLEDPLAKTIVFLKYLWGDPRKLVGAKGSDAVVRTLVDRGFPLRMDSCC